MRLNKLLAVVLMLTSLGAAAQETVAGALRAYESGNYAEAAKLLKPWADKGDPIAQLKLGTLYYAGKGVAENERMAVELLKKSAAQGNTEAMYQLGNAFTFGHETPKLATDPDIEAAQWYFRAASAGNADAQYSLGLLFMAGKGVERNDEEAAQWMRKAAKNGHKDAQSFVDSKSRH